MCVLSVHALVVREERETTVYKMHTICLSLCPKNYDDIVGGTAARKVALTSYVFVCVCERVERRRDHALHVPIRAGLRCRSVLTYVWSRCDGNFLRYPRLCDVFCQPGIMIEHTFAADLRVLGDVTVRMLMLLLPLRLLQLLLLLLLVFRCWCLCCFVTEEYLNMFAYDNIQQSVSSISALPL